MTVHASIVERGEAMLITVCVFVRGELRKG